MTFMLNSTWQWKTKEMDIVIALYMMMPKNHQWATQSSHAWNNTCTIIREDLTKSTTVVSAKYPPLSQGFLSGPRLIQY